MATADSGIIEPEWTAKSMVGISHEENIIPSHISLALWDINEELKDFHTCLAESVQFLSDSRNDEPYVYIRNSRDEPYTTTSFTSKIGLDMACLFFAGAFHIQVEDSSDSPKCLREVGGYLYKNVIIPNGICGDLNIYVTYIHEGPVFLSFQSPSNHNKCCYLEFSVTTKGKCLLYPEMERILDHSGDLLAIYERYTVSGKKGFTAFKWQGACMNNFPFTLDKQDRFAEVCMTIILYLNTVCNFKLVYQQSLYSDRIKSASEENNIRPEVQTCSKHTCYVFLRSEKSISWTEAHFKCEKRNGSLVSINSDSEWKMLSSPSFLPDLTALFYIGYRTEVTNQGLSYRKYLSLQFGLKSVFLSQSHCSD